MSLLRRTVAGTLGPVALLLAGCATATMVPFVVESEPPGALVDVNGVSLGATPTQIQLRCVKRWVGVLNAPGGWAYANPPYAVTVYPSRQAPGISQTKWVNPCEIATPPGRLHFNLGLDSVTPRQRIDIQVTPGAARP